MTTCALALIASIAVQDAGALAERYLAARTAAMQAAATPADVDRVADLLTENAIYEHPAFGMRISGRDAIRTAMAGQLGRTREVRSEIISRSGLRAVSALTEQLSFDARDGSGWTPVKRTQLLLIESRDGKIAKIVEYWDK